MHGFCTGGFIDTLGCSGFWFVMIALVVTCIGFNAIIDWLFRQGKKRVTVYLVMAGCAIVVVSFGLVRGIDDALVLFVMFAVSGGLMWGGAMRRHYLLDNEEESAINSAQEIFKKFGWM